MLLLFLTDPYFPSCLLVALQPLLLPHRHPATPATIPPAALGGGQHNLFFIMTPHWS
jgi:hypothetical protein